MQNFHFRVQDHKLWNGPPIWTSDRNLGNSTFACTVQWCIFAINPFTISQGPLKSFIQGHVFRRAKKIWGQDLFTCECNYLVSSSLQVCAFSFPFAEMYIYILHMCTYMLSAYLINLYYIITVHLLHIISEDHKCLGLASIIKLPKCEIQCIRYKPWYLSLAIHSDSWWQLSLCQSRKSTLCLWFLAFLCCGG